MVQKSSASVVHAPDDLRQALTLARSRGLTTALVPTMGALHDGHLALVHEARRRAHYVAVSIFVNPTQFGPNEDLARYPRDLSGDVAKVAGAGADLVFAPEVSAMYPPGDQTRVHVGDLADGLCGPLRPGHFEGVATVVSKLFALAGPSVVIFGKKDYQQLAILRRVALDLFFPVDVVGHPIVRHDDGLAMSSRNAYLTPDERRRALGLARGLSRAGQAFVAGERNAGKLRSLARAEVAAVTDAIEYVDVVDADSLSTFADDALLPERALVAIAARIGGTRLIDNTVFGEDAIPNVPS